MIPILEDNIVVVVFPSIFSQNKIGPLITNIKKALKIQNQKFQKIRQDDKAVSYTHLTLPTNREV